MTEWRHLTPEDMDYAMQGRTILASMLSGAEVIEAPELQALYDWCLQQDWDVSFGALEEYGPVLALGVGFGDQVACSTGMQWVWVTKDQMDWFGLALKWPDKPIFSFPTRMLTQRLHDRLAIRLAPLIEAHVSDLNAVAHGTHPALRNP
ncbi:DUF3806 domain-containing protein [Gemmobacter denitrificans]|uniref:DUF3806 domain-containing protein n=1 Tax=Gemmobacter denitrificans TaxID=3123040 RepID=A0ABU8C1M2_9RHOB